MPERIRHLFPICLFTRFTLIFVETVSPKTALQASGMGFSFLSVSLFAKTDRSQYLAGKRRV